MTGFPCSGAILPVPEKMQAKVGDGVKAIAFGGISGGIAFWTTTDPDQLAWNPPTGCVDTGPPNGRSSYSGEMFRSSSGNLPPVFGSIYDRFFRRSR